MRNKKGQFIKGKHKKKICLNCGIEFLVIPYRENTAKYCSKQCTPPRQKSLEVYKGICVCGKEFTVQYKHQLNLRKFCSISCSSKYIVAPKLNSYIKLHGSPHKGKKMSEEQKKKLSKSKKGNKNMLGKHHSEETRKKISLAVKGKHKGQDHYNWKGGKGTERHRLMHQSDYILWRTAVFMRDDYTCQICGQHGGRLEADHIKPWALYPELRYAIDNGRTLCILCHRQTDTWGNKLMYRKVSD